MVDEFKSISDQVQDRVRWAREMQKRAVFSRQKTTELHEARVAKQADVAQAIRLYTSEVAKILVKKAVPAFKLEPTMTSFWIICVEQTGGGSSGDHPEYPKINEPLPITKRGIGITSTGEMIVFEDAERTLSTSGNIIRPIKQDTLLDDILVPISSIDMNEDIPGNQPQAIKWQEYLINYVTTAITTGSSIPPFKEWLHGDRGGWRQI